MLPRRPDEAAPLKAFLRHHQTGAVKQQHLDPVAALRTEHHDHARMDVDAERMAGHRRKTIMTLPEINQTPRKSSLPNRERSRPHLEAAGNLHNPLARLCTPEDEPQRHGPRSSPLRTRRRHVERHCGKRPWRHATSWAVTPGSKVSKTIRARHHQANAAGREPPGPCTSSHCRTNTPFSIAFIPRHGHVIKITLDGRVGGGIAAPRPPVTVGMRIAAHPPRRSGRGR